MEHLMHGLDADLDDLQQYDGWWAQEKYRGVRVFWDGEYAWTRQGRPVTLSIAQQLPQGMALDCELYDGVDGERRCASAVRFGDKHLTDTMRVVVFDVPEHGGTTQERQAALGELTLPRTAFIAGHTVVRDEAHLLTLLDRVQSQQGEGLMLRRPGARYVAGRSMDFVKVKYGR